MIGGRAVPFGLVTERSGTEIWGIPGLPRSMAFGIAASAREMESSAASTVVSAILLRRSLGVSAREIITCYTANFLYQRDTWEGSEITHGLMIEFHMGASLSCEDANGNITTTENHYKWNSSIFSLHS